jgi:hypothetical protein
MVVRSLATRRIAEPERFFESLRMHPGAEVQLAACARRGRRLAYCVDARTKYHSAFDAQPRKRPLAAPADSKG